MQNVFLNVCGERIPRPLAHFWLEIWDISGPLLLASHWLLFKSVYSWSLFCPSYSEPEFLCWSGMVLLAAMGWFVRKMEQNWTISVSHQTHTKWSHLECKINLIFTLWIFPGFWNCLPRQFGFPEQIFSSS